MSSNTANLYLTRTENSPSAWAQYSEVSIRTSMSDSPLLLFCASTRPWTPLVPVFFITTHMYTTDASC